MTTYADALAACREQWGEPTWQRRTAAGWVRGASEVRLYVPIGRRTPSVSLYASTSGEHPERADWMVAGPSMARAPLTPLPDAIAAAGRWLAAREVTP